jgi:cobalt-zinc-cadmium efflux system protein
MGHDHDHHHVAPKAMGSAFAISIGLNLVFVVVEGVFGVVAHSTALLADAAHNLSDVLGLAMAFGATLLARRRPSARHTFGFRRSTILAALANALLLVFAVGGVAWEAIVRFRAPAVPEGPTMMAVAAVGIVVNTVSALVLRRGQQDDVNVRGAFLHLVADALVSLGVVVAGAIVWRTGWQVVDPITSLVISVVVLVGTWSLLKDAQHLSMDGVPPGEHPLPRGYNLDARRRRKRHAVLESQDQAARRWPRRRGPAPRAPGSHRSRSTCSRPG